MKKIPPTPLARRNLGGQLTSLDGAPRNWPSEHLRRACEIVEKQLDPQAAKEMVLDAVRAADRAVKRAYQTQLRDSSRSALRDFINNCRAIASSTAPKKLRKEVRIQLDEAARSTFADGADLESIAQFFCKCQKIVEGWPQDQTAHTIFRHLVTDKDDRTPGKYRLEGNRPKIALDYEILPAQTRSACESSLAQLISEKTERLTAHDVYACLYGVALGREITAQLESEPDIIHDYLAELDGLWTNRGLELGRGNDPADPDYMSPFHEFVERVLLNQRDPASRLFAPPSEQEFRTIWENYYKLPKDWRAAGSAAPVRGSALITDWTLRTYLDRRSSAQKSE